PAPVPAAAPAEGAAPAVATPDTVQVVTFVLVAPGARRVALVGDFNDWDVGATQLRPAPAGRLWSVEVPLTPGRHRYAFVVDGERWLADPAAPRAPGPDFGSPNSVVTVTPERRS
ncbi:MAG TPA: isoamylase early set domain-containing protein, partial [Gemmatimonadaceae bacterium]